MSPVLVSGGYTWTSINGDLSGNSTTGLTCGVLKDSETAYCWGYGGSGQLGDGSNTDSNVPVLVSGGLSWESISADSRHVCGVTTAATAYCWGYNVYGQIGDGTDTWTNTPTLISGVHSWASVSPGGDQTCGVTTAGEAYCWGRNNYGQIGDGTTIDRWVPVKVSGS